MRTFNICKTHRASIFVFASLQLLLWSSPAVCATTATSGPSPRTLERIEASVNQGLVLTSDVQKFRKTWELRKQLDPLFMDSRLQALGPQADAKWIVDFLIEEKIILQQFPASDAQVEQEIQSIQANNKIDRSELKQALLQQGFQFDDYFEMIRTGVSKRNLLDTEIRSKVTITDDDIRNYFYNKFVKDSSSPKQFKASIITAQTSNYASPAAARAALEQVAKDIRQGEAFDSAAKRVSDDATASEGGSLGSLSEEDLSPLFKDTLKKLQLGQVSEVLADGKDRYLLLKLDDVSTGDNSRLQKMKEEIRGQLASQEFQNQIRLWIERSKQSTFIHRASETPSQQKAPSPKKGS